MISSASGEPPFSSKSAARPRHSVAVFCAAANGARPEYRQIAEKLGRALAARSLGLIYGGARAGLMGAVANAAKAAGGYVVGVIPTVLVDKEVAHDGLSELHITSTMHTRKALMSERADAFIIMPGGFGTLEELFEVLAWQSLDLHAKPVILLNAVGFYDPMLRFVEHAEAEGMLRGHRHRLLVADTVERAIALTRLPNATA